MSREFLQLKTSQELANIIKNNVTPFHQQERIMVDLKEARRQILAELLKAGEDLPPFSRSAVDGYAARAEDTYGAGPDLPVYLDVIGEVEMGKSTSLEVNRGEAAAIPTGGMLPRGADCCIMIEDTEKIPDGRIEVMTDLAPGQHVIHQGDDIKAESVLLEAGSKLGAPEIGALAGLGYNRVPVFPALKAAVISTGNELISPEEERRPGKIRDINSYALGALLAEWGLKPFLYGIVEDSPRDLSRSLEECRESDLILLSGGSSVGVKDLSIDVINQTGSPGVVLHGLAVKPGKPTILGFLEETPVLGLPGNPASALVIAALIIPALVRLIRGLSLPTKEEIYLTAITARLEQPISSAPGREEFFPVALTRKRGGREEGVIAGARPIAGKSNLITTLVESAGVVRIAAGQEGLSAGSPVEVISLSGEKGLLFRREIDKDG